MPSTVIRRFDYAPEGRELLVEFVTGRRYVYCDVPEDEAAAMQPARRSLSNRPLRSVRLAADSVRRKAPIRTNPTDSKAVAAA